MMIGVSMAAAMVICIAAFIWLYVQVGPLLSDFIPQDTAGDEPETTGLIGTADDDPADDDAAIDDFTLDEIEPEPAGTPDATDDEDGVEEDDIEIDDASDDNAALDEEEAEFDPTHEIRDGPNVNFRSGPNTISEAQGSLSPGTQLMFLGEEEPSGGVTWLYLQIEDGTEGWIRDIDLIEYDEDDGSDEDDD